MNGMARIVERMSLRAILLAVIGLAVVPSRSFAAESVVVQEIDAPKSCGAEKIDQAMRVAAVEAGLKIVTDKALQRAAKNLPSGAGAKELARGAGGDLLLAVSIRKVGKKFVAKAELTLVETGQALVSVKKAYRRAAEASAIGGEIAREVFERWKANAANSESAAKGGRGGTSKVAVVPKDEVGVGASQEGGPGARAEGGEKASESGPVRRGASPPSSPLFGESRMIRFSLGGGSQLRSAYTVTVGGQATGLAYTLSPLVLLEAGASVTIPDTGVALELAFSFVPVKYEIDVDPAVDPRRPGGRFIDIDGRVSYRFDLIELGSSRDEVLFVEPTLGVSYSSLTVQAQKPFAVIVSSSALAPAAGARFGVALGALVFEAIARGLLILSYSEEPDQTGESGGGIGLEVGAGAQYWISTNLGLFVGLGYEYARISLSGQGTRTPFVDDPVLEDATVFHGDIKASAGALFGV